MTPKERSAMQQALEALEETVDSKYGTPLTRKAITALREALVEQAEQEPFKMICPRCKVDRVTTQCPNRGGIGDCPMTATAQNAAPVKTICYQEVYDALEAQLIKEPTGNGLDQAAQNNGLIIAMNTLQKMNLAGQAEQDPAAWMNTNGAVNKMREAGWAINAAPVQQAEQEPVCIDWDTKTDEPIMGYAAPVRTKDLTDDEIMKAWNESDDMTLPEFARAVIAADREKNK